MSKHDICYFTGATTSRKRKNKMETTLDIFTKETADVLKGDKEVLLQMRATHHEHRRQWCTSLTSLSRMDSLSPRHFTLPQFHQAKLHSEHHSNNHHSFNTGVLHYPLTNHGTHSHSTQFCTASLQIVRMSLQLHKQNQSSFFERTSFMNPFSIMISSHNNLIPLSQKCYCTVFDMFMYSPILVKLYSIGELAKLFLCI